MLDFGYESFKFDSNPTKVVQRFPNSVT